jgi:outer membrane protein assembly factor BamA/autotransporter translocation and assembly factor TamB
LNTRSGFTKRRIAVIGGGVIAVALLAVAAVHSPRARARVLGVLNSQLAQSGYVAGVGGIDYNLATLTVRLSDVTLATSRTPSKPFFAAKQIDASFPWGVLFGRVDVTRLEVLAPRITLLRDADGSDNWTTETTRPSSAAPSSVRIGYARVSHLVFIWTDEQTSSHVEAGLSLELTPDGHAVSGPITMSGPTFVRWRDGETHVDAVGGRLSWNERDLSLHAFSLRGREGTFLADGRIASLLGEPRIDVQLTGDVDVAQISRWVVSDRQIAGTAHADARLVGPIASPDVQLTSLHAQVAGGTVNARGRASFGRDGDLRVEWNRLELASLVKSAIGEAPRATPAERLSGSLDAQWTAPRLEHVRLTAQSRAVETNGDAAGLAKLEMHGTEFGLSVEDLVAFGVHADGTLHGTLNAEALSRSPIQGSVDVQADDAEKLTRALVESRVIRSAPPVRGTAQGRFIVGGTFDAPSLDGSLDSSLQYASARRATLRARAAITRAEIRLSEIEARLSDSAVRGAFRWTIDSGALDGTLTGSLQLGNLRELVTVPDTLPLDGTIDLQTRLGGSLARPRVAIDAGGRALEVAGQRIDRLTAGMQLIGSELAVDRLLLESGAGRVEANGGVDLTRETYAARVTITDVPIRPIVGVGAEDLPISGSLDGSFDGQGSLRRFGGRGTLSVADARWRDADLGRITGDFGLAGRDVSFALDASDLALKGSGTVSVEPNGPVSLRGRWEPDDVAAVARRLAVALPPSSSGSASVGFELIGLRDRLSEARALIAADRLDVTLADQSIRLVRPGRIESDSHTLRVDDIALATGTSNLTVAGSIGESAGRPLSLALDGSLSDFGFIRKLIQPGTTDTADQPLPTGAIRARFTAEGSLAQPRIAGSFQIAGGRVPLTDQASVTDIEIGATYDNGVVTVERANASFEGATLVASAKIPSNVFIDRLPSSVQRFITRADGVATLSAQARSITPSVAAPFVSLETLGQIALQAEASLALQTDRLELDRVRGTITLPRAEVSVAGVSFDQQTTTRLVVGDGRVTVDTLNWGREDNRVAVRGGITLGEDPALDLVATSTLDLRLLNIVTPTARVLGRADAEMRVGGTASAPTIDGFVTVSNGEARVADPRLIVGDLAGTVTLAGDRLTLEHLSATVNGGNAVLAGSIRHRWLTPLDGEVTFRASGSSLDLTGLRAEADAVLTYTLGSDGAALGGTVTLLRSAYREPLTSKGGLLGALRRPAVSSDIAASSTFDRTRLDVRLVTGDDLLVDNDVARLTLRSDLRFVGTLSRPSVTGRATLGEGGVLFFGGNRYRLEDQGSIDFANPNEIEPDLDLTAVTRVQGTEIKLTLKGTPATLQPTLDSPDDPYKSQSDLVSLLLIGRTADSGDGYAPGGDELLGLLGGALLGAAGRAIGLDSLRVERGTPDVVRFDAGLVASETNPGARLTFGKTIGSKTEVIFSQSLQQGGGLTWIVGYAPWSAVDLRAVSLDVGDRRYEFTHDVTLGATRRAAESARATASRISDVTFAGAGTDEPALRRRLKLQPGDRFSFFEWQDDRERLERFYGERQHFEARITARRLVDPSDATRVRLTYDVREGPRTVVIVDGFQLSQSTMDAIQNAWTRSVVDDFLSDEAAALARADAVDAGFVLPSVDARVERRQDEKALRLTIDAGARVRDRRVEFSGNVQERSERLRAVLAERDLERSVWVEPNRVRDGLQAFYRSNGYLNASVRVDAIEISGPTAIRPIHVDEGDAFRVRSVRIDGVRAISSEEAVRVTGLSTGDRFMQQRVEQAQLALDRHYRARGFNHVAILQEAAADSSRADVDVTITVDEGRQQRLREVVTTGLRRTSPELVSRALKLEVGAPVDLAAWNTARRRLYETGAFRSVDIQREVVSAATADGSPEEPVRATVTVQEWPPLRVRYGLELLDQLQAAGDAARANAPASEGQGGRTLAVGLAGDVGFRNLFARAISAGAAARYTPDARAARVYATAPSFFGMPITSNVFFERSLERVGAEAVGGAPTAEVQRTDLTFEQRVRTGRRTEISYSYTRERNHTFALNPDPFDPLPFDLTVTLSKLASNMVIDRRNDLSDATLGWFHSSGLQYAPPAFGSDVRFVKYLLRQYYFRQAGPLVFATAMRLGLASAFDQTLIPSERFFAGGGNTVRGYAEDVLTPFDRFGDAVGGSALVVFNQEVRFPMFKYVRGVGFFDAGRAFDEVAHLSLGDLSASGGFGVRVHTPFVLLRVDVGFPFDPAAGPRRARWFFSLGQLF